MGTGDLKNCANQLRVALRQGKYNKDVNYEHLMYGYPQEFLPLLHYILLQYSLKITKFLLSKGYELSGKRDVVFIEIVYKVMRVEFSYIPKINKDKFFLNGFAEQKILFVVNVFNKIVEKNKLLNKMQAKKKTTRSGPRTTSLNCENGSSDKENYIPKEQIPSQQQPPPQQPPPQQQLFRSKDYPDPQLDDSLFITSGGQRPQSEVQRTYEAPQYVEDDHWGQSIVQPPFPLSFPPPEKSYTECDAKDIFISGESEEVDSTPFNSITTVQHVSITELQDSSLDVVVVKPNFDLSELNGTILEENGQADVVTNSQDSVEDRSQNISCVSCDELKQLILSLTARIDVLECRVTMLEGPQKVSVLRDQEYDQSSHQVSLAPPDYEAVNAPTSFTDAQDRVTEPSKDNSNLPTPLDNSVSDDSEDLQKFIVSVQQRLLSQKSILDCYTVEPQ